MADTKSGTDPISVITSGLSGIFQTLPQLGVGTKSRQKEIAAMSEAERKLAEQKAKTTTKILIVSGVMIVVIAIIFLTLRRK